MPPGYCMSYLPPNFYAGGCNPQYPAFCELMKYAQRVCHLLASGTHCGDAALYYPAEVDWMNCGFEQDLDDVTAALTRGGVDFDLLPGDTLLADARVENGVLHVADETYRALIAPHGEVYPEALLRRFEAFADAGLPVIFCDALPERCEKAGADLSGLSGRFRAVPLSEIPGIVKADGKSMFTVTPLISELRTFAWKLPDGTSCCILMNESRSTVTFSIRCRGESSCAIYDPWKNVLSRGTSSENGCAVRLDPQQLLVAIFGTDCGELPEYEAELPVMHELALRYDISIRETGSSDSFRILRRNSEPVNLLKEENLTRFCGELLYESTFDCDDPALRHLAIPGCGDCAELWLNDAFCGLEIGPVCRFDIRGKLRKGKNRIRIRTAGNPAYVDRDPEKPLYGTALPLCKHGFTGNILIG